MERYQQIIKRDKVVIGSSEHRERAIAGNDATRMGVWGNRHYRIIQPALCVFVPSIKGGIFRSCSNRPGIWGWEVAPIGKGEHFHTGEIDITWAIERGIIVKSVPLQTLSQKAKNRIRFAWEKENGPIK